MGHMIWAISDGPYHMTCSGEKLNPGLLWGHLGYKVCCRLVNDYMSHAVFHTFIGRHSNNT